MLERCAQNKSRIAIQKLLVEHLEGLNEEQQEDTIELLKVKEHRCRLGPAGVKKALESWLGENTDSEVQAMVDSGDAPGLAAAAAEVAEGSQESKKWTSATPLSIKQLREELREIASFSGKGAKKSREEKLEKLLSNRITGKLEVKYLIGLILGDLQANIGPGTMEPAIVKATGKRSSTASCSPGRPVDGMQCKQGSLDFSVTVMLMSQPGRGGPPWVIEYKYDGERFLVHNTGSGSLLSFSRSGDKTTDKYADVLSKIQECLKDPGASFICDGEVLAFNATTGEELPLNTLSTRRDTIANGQEPTVPARVRFFDCLHYDGKDLMSQPLSERWRILTTEIFKDGLVNSSNDNAFVKLVHREEVDDSDESGLVERMDTAWKEVTDKGIEGLVIKSQNSDYQPGKRTRWIKIKQTETLDVVIVGVKLGNNAQAGRVGSFLVAVRNESAGPRPFCTLCFVGAGLTEKMRESFNISANTVQRQPKDVEVKSPDQEPVKWIAKRHRRVMEVNFTSFTPAGSLRHPRFVGWRDDKNPEQVNTLEEVEEMMEKN